MTDEATLRGWVERRTPPVPGGFQSWMAPADPGAMVSVSALMAEARRSLARLESPGDRPRDGAFDLLAADGFVTWACEAALEDADPVASLPGIVDALLE